MCVYELNLRVPMDFQILTNEAVKVLRECIKFLNQSETNQKKKEKRATPVSCLYVSVYVYVNKRYNLEKYEFNSKILYMF